MTTVSPDIVAASRGDSDPSSRNDQWLLAERIAASRSFGRSKLLREFLFHLCSRHTEGRTSELTERQIGIHVFGRLEGYDSSDDNIVRNYARRLRKRVEEYFATEGTHEELGLDIPRGSYIPVFYARLPKETMREETRPVEVSSGPFIESIEVQGCSPSPSPREAIPCEHASSKEPVRHKRIHLWVIASCSLLAVAALATCELPKMRRADLASAAQANLSSALWSQLFQRDRDTFIVAADAGLVIMEGLSGRSISLDEYSSGRYRSAASFNSKLSNDELEELGTRRYTSIVDLELVFRLSRLKEANPEHVLLRYSRDLHLDNLRSGNAILLGSADSNPWASLFEQQLNFRFSFDPKKRGAPVIINQRPLAGEQPIYRNDYDGPWHKTYGTISWLPNLDGTGHVLLIAGIDMAGTQAAGSFVLSPSLMNPVLDRATAPDGTIRSFEILIESNNVAANASRPHAVIERMGR